MVLPGTLPLQGREFDRQRLMDDVHIQTGCVTVRLCFYKVGRLQYISHLDLQRMMKHAIARADLPVWFSEGFNPTPRMAFATPLSIGVQSLCEFVDIKFTRPVTAGEILDAWNPCLPEELQLYYAAPPKAKLTDAGWAGYEIRLTHPDASEEKAQEITALPQEPVIVTKRSKSGDKEADISPYIRELSCTCEDGTLAISCSLCADNQNFLNPEYVIKAVTARCGLAMDDPMTAGYTVLRTNLFLPDGITPFD